MVPNKDQLVATLDTVIEGVKAGELMARGVPKAKRAPTAGIRAVRPQPHSCFGAGFVACRGDPCCRPDAIGAAIRCVR